MMLQENGIFKHINVALNNKFTLVNNLLITYYNMSPSAANVHMQWSF
jgi:hypothetical protein